ncbi:hypothetical protein R50345_06045 [Paenibacillus sp. FSL R5-0345]|uniref:phBC6A51 family helix-turn-helix protein n=1 Tax=Paenibacillus sp. FSL R5-0345 TaxID=1536770 RepID=UPI0004F71356|nr:phBC6A51 family helix-turn-helix protein [Paenibacillus sp. FSL R5-0345]AIQ34222.1 hypothetical protein R50345_06045 [Paenibacillus sp. FSL R5-0345]
MAETVTQVDTYKPTGNEMKLIEALSNPENRDLNISQVCELIGISRQAYYKMFKKQDFVKYYNQFQLDLVKSSIGDIIKATIFFGVNDPKCHQDRKLILEMGNVYTPKQELKHEGSMGVTIVNDIPRNNKIN